MIQYIVGAAIGFVINELMNEDKLKKAEQQNAAPAVINPSIDGIGEEPEPEGEEVKFVAKSRGKKKPQE